MVLLFRNGAIIMLLQLVGPLLEVRGKNAEPNTVLTYVDDHHVEAHGTVDDTDVARVLCSVVMYKKVEL